MAKEHMGRMILDRIKTYKNAAALQHKNRSYEQQIIIMAQFLIALKMYLNGLRLSWR